MVERNFRPSRPYLILVEGRDEVNFLQALLDDMQVTETDVIDVGGKAAFSDFLRALLAAPDFDRVVRAYAIIRDADGDAAGAFASIRDALRRSGEAYPPGAGDWANGGRRVGVFIVPGADRAGMLEDLVLEAVRHHPIVPLMYSYYHQLYGVIDVGARPRNLSKSRVQTFLAAMPDLTPSLGVAAKRGYWPLNHQAFDELRRFLTGIRIS